MDNGSDPLARFWSKVDQTTRPDGCWTWMSSRNPQGYGYFWDSDRKTMCLAHRFAYEHFVGPLEHLTGRCGASGQVVCHTCDNPSCVRPDHLFVGSQQDNIHDAKTKGRMTRRNGERNGRSKLTMADVAAIRAAATGRYGERSAIARQWGISTGHVSKILKEDVWM